MIISIQQILLCLIIGRTELSCSSGDKCLGCEILKNNKGFTLIELLVTLGLSALVISLAITFFVMNIKNYISINNDSEMQFQAQYMFNFMANKIMESESISLVRKDEIYAYSITLPRTAGDNLLASKISFKFGEGISENYVFHLVNGNIRYGIGGKDIKPTVELGSFVKTMSISLLYDESLGNAKVLKIKLIFEKDNQTFEAEQVVYMRNN